MILLLLLSGEAFAFNPHQTDKKLHITVAAASTAVLGGLLKENTNYTRTQSVIASMLIVNAAGLVKEFALDKSMDGGDMIANGIGSAVGGLTLGVYFQFE